RLARLLEQAAADPARPLSELEILTPAERHQVLVDWNDTVRAVPPATVPELVAAQAVRTPEAVAVASADGSLTYAELDARADHLAGVLAAHGAGPERFVAVALPRTPDLVVALLAVLRSGAAYLPVDLDYPAERIAFMLDDARPALTITQEFLAGAVNQP